MASWPRRPVARRPTWPGTRSRKPRRSRRQRVRPPRGTFAIWWLLLGMSLGLCSFLALGWPERGVALLTWLPLAGNQSGWLLLGVALVLVLALAGVLTRRLRGPRLRSLTRLYAQQQSLRALQAMDPLAFEQYIGRLFELEGYQVTFTPHSGDEGIDLWLTRPPQRRRLGAALAPIAGRALVGGRQPRIPVQCKRYASDHAVGSPELHAFSGALRGALAEEGYFVTTSRFTPAAEAWAQKEGIQLIDGPALVRLIQRLPPGHAKSPVE